jgi:2-oxoisovalerate dehydrogenase E1 component alpha subunit
LAALEFGLTKASLGEVLAPVLFVQTDLFRVRFPGAVNSAFTHEMRFSNPTSYEAMPTYRIMDSDGNIVDPSRDPSDVPKEEAIKMYTDMLTVSIMDLIMFDAQRQGRLSFYMVSAGEEGIAVGSASALSPEDVIFAQYREAAALKYRGFTLDNFMSQLFANKNDNGKGRNMPVHYGSGELNIVSF